MNKFEKIKVIVTIELIEHYWLNLVYSRYHLEKDGRFSDPCPLQGIEADLRVGRETA
ncbi:hypothetical protein [Geobacillus sp. PK12]|uniref:hypothetical protein n=1 Tax=Geobacillus sp. PK12 TaxID=2508525 RepID=UPI0013E96C58|nr:hypothetical protein [Geobacillus sp. PK12]